VARRVALKARVRDAVRAARSPASLPAPTPDPACEAAVRELQAILDEEISRLPEAYRLAFLLCVLEGKSRAEAAAELGLNEGTLSGRLARARLLLRDRLAKRGVQFAAAVAVADLASSASSAPSGLVRAAVEASVAGRGDAAVVALAGVLRLRLAMSIATGLIACAAVAAGLVIGNSGPLPDPTPPAAAKPAESPVALDARGDPLPAGAIARLGSARWRHEGEARSMAFSPNGKTLAVLSGNDGVITFFETATGKVVQHLVATEDSLRAPGAIAFAPDGKTFACRLWDGTIQLWDMQTKKPARTLAPPEQDFGGSHHRICFSPDGKRLAVWTGPRDRITIWDVASGKESAALQGHNHGNPPLAFSPDGKVVFLGVSDPEVQLWDSTTGKYIRGFDTGEPAFSLAVSPDGKAVASGGRDRIGRVRRRYRQGVGAVGRHRDGRGSRPSLYPRR
jgi:hypothetical protein